MELDKFKFRVNKDNYIYIIEKNNDEYILKRISENKDIIIIRINNNLVSLSDNINYLDILKKDFIINDIIESLKSNLLTDFINFNELKRRIKSTYIKTDVENDNIGLISIDNSLYVILLSTNDIIGQVKMDYDIKVKVEKEYLKDTLILLTDYINIIKNNKKLIKC